MLHNIALNATKKQMQQEELQALAKHIRRMYTSLYEDLEEPYNDTDDVFLTKLDDANKGKKAFSEWTAREYMTLKWF